MCGKGMYTKQNWVCVRKKNVEWMLVRQPLSSLHKQSPFGDLTLKQQLLLAIHNFNPKYSINNYCVYKRMTFESSNLQLPKGTR